MAKIHKLSPALADMIAAGEVVERPASVIKELVENSIDAGATRITVEIKNGGITFMRVTDDGCGISREDAPTAFLRHATSKISCADDLGCIETMGFRGEALAAISAVSKVDLMTRAAEEDMGTSIRVEAGNVLEVQSAGCPQGTTMVVRELFYNTPARMKFLKRDSVEGSYISGAVQRQALGHPEIAFRFIRDGKQELSTPGDGKLSSAIYHVMGRTCAQEMVEVEHTAGAIRVSGYVGKPTASRGSRSYQHFFVNGRYVKSRTMMAALEEAYRNQLMVGRYPICVLSVRLPAAAVDVNVHPAKTEIKFLRENDVFDAIRYGVLGTLTRAEAKPEMVLPKQKPPAQLAESGPQAAAGIHTAAGPAASGQSPLRSSDGSRQQSAAPAQKPDFYQHMNAEEYRRAMSAAAGNGNRSGNAGNTGNAMKAPAAERAVSQTAAGNVPRSTGMPVSVIVHDSVNRIPKPQAVPNADSRTEVTADGTFVVHSARPRTELPRENPEQPAEAKIREAAAEPEPLKQAEITQKPEAQPVQTAEVPEVQSMQAFQDGDQNTEQTALELPEVPEAMEMPESLPQEQSKNPKKPEAQPYRIIGETMKTYILVEQGNELLLIDKHAAHERILFEKFRAQRHEIVTQLLLSPLQVSFSQEETSVLLENTKVLEDLGFEIEDYGGNTTLIRAIPSEIDEKDAPACLSELAQTLLTGSRPDSSTVFDEMLHTVACKAAIKGGWDTDPKEIAALVAELMRRDDIKYCPHGRPVCIRISRYNLERQFKRT